MNSFIPIFSAFFILLGLLVWRFPKLIAGYNTMTPEQQKKVDVKGLKAFMCRVFCAIGILVFVSYLLLRLFMDEASAINISSIVVPIIGVIYLQAGGQRYDHNYRDAWAIISFTSQHSPSRRMHQNGTDLASVNSFIRQADSKPLATKCMGTNRPVRNTSRN